MSNKKRVSLYFNLDIPDEKEMWEFLEYNKRKSDTIKKLLSDKINNTDTIKYDKKSVNNALDVTKDEIGDIFND